MNERGQYGLTDKRYGRGAERVGANWLDKAKAHASEISDEEMHQALDAANLAMSSLSPERLKLRLAWNPATQLSHEQMLKIMQIAMSLAHETEKNLVAMIDKVPAHWEGHLTPALTTMRKRMSDAPKFEGLIARWTSTKPVPAFQMWIDHLLGNVEDGVGAIAYVAEVEQNWIGARDLLSGLYHGAISLLHGIIDVARGKQSLYQPLHPYPPLYQQPPMMAPQPQPASAYVRGAYRVAADIPESAQEVTRKLDDKILDLAKTWKPPGAFDPADIIKIVDQTSKLIQSARHAVGEAPHSTGDAETSIKIALGRLDRDAKQGLSFIAMARAALITKTRIPAPALKPWVLNSMTNASVAFLTAATLEGNLPWAVKAIAAFQHVFDAVADAIKGVGSTAVEFVEDVGEGVKDVVKALPTAVKVAGIAVLGLAGVWVVSKVASAGKST